MRSLIALVMLVSMICTMGCSGTTPNSAVAGANKTNIARLTNLYGLYQSHHKLKGPKDEASFKAYLSSLKPELFESIGVDPNAIEELFISENDGEPFNIRYSVMSTTRGSKEPVVFEKTGSSGKRMVGFLNMVQREVDNDEYDRLLNGQ